MVAKRIRTLVVDDSVFMRTILKGALEKAPNIEVIGTAQNGNEALEKVAKLKPDVMTLDIEMPGLDGIGVLEKVMADSPMPIVMISTKTQEGAKLTFDALELGAVDYVPKPLADKSASLQGFREAVVRAVEAAFQVNRKRLRPDGQKPLQRPNSTELDIEGRVIAIGISAGGPATLHKLIPVIPPGFPPIVVTQHMPADFTGPFAKRLDAASEITVCEAKTGETLEPGKLILAAGDRHLRVIKRGGGLCASLDDGPKVAGFRPSVDVLFESVAKTVGDGAIGLVMTGMGCDGADGIRKLKAAGAKTLSQDAESSVVYGMPKAAFNTGCVDQVVSLEAIPQILAAYLRQRAAAGVSTG